MTGAEFEEDNECGVVEQSKKSSLWNIFGSQYPRNEIVFIAQILVIYTVVAVSLFNLTQDGDNKNVWIALLSSSLGYLLPAPSIRRS